MKRVPTLTSAIAGVKILSYKQLKHHCLRIKDQFLGLIFPERFKMLLTLRVAWVSCTYRSTVYVYCKWVHFSTFKWLEMTSEKDNCDDWRYDGSRVCDIYSESHLTIAASKSKGSKECCYAVADTTCDSTHWISNAKNEQYSIHVRKRILHLDRGSTWARSRQVVSPHWT